MFTLITSCKDVTSCLSFLATEETPQRVHQAGNMKQQDTQKNVPRQNDCHRTKNPARQLDPSLNNLSGKVQYRTFERSTNHPRCAKLNG